MDYCPFTKEYCGAACQLWSEKLQDCVFGTIADRMGDIAEQLHDIADVIDAGTNRNEPPSTMEARSPEDEKLDASVDYLDLSVRSWNCLKRANIDTVRQIIETAKYKPLTSIRNFGYKSDKEVRDRVMAYCGVDIYAFRLNQEGE